MKAVALYHMEEIPVFVNNFLAMDALSHLSHERRCDVKLCLFELLTNIFTHGEGDLVVRMRYAVSSGQMALIIYEEGGHWDGQGILTGARCLEDGLFDEGGRGLYLVQRVSDELAYCGCCKGVFVRMGLRGGAHGKGQ